MFNPDYPTSAGGFLQHTYQPENQNQSMFYNGFASNPFAQVNDPFRSYTNQCAPDSRRNFSMPQQQPQQYNAYGCYTQPVMSQPQTEQVVPFGTYPPATPVGNAAPTGLNAVIESRRNVNMTITPGNATATNPWANTQTTQIQQQPTVPVMQNQVNQNPFANPFACGYQVEPSMTALYVNEVKPFDKKTVNCWDNQYTMNRPLDQPNNVDWYGTANQNPYGYYTQPQVQQNLNPLGSTFNAAPVRFNPQAESYLDIAKKNWSNVNL